MKTPHPEFFTDVCKRLQWTPDDLAGWFGPEFYLHELSASEGRWGLWRLLEPDDMIVEVGVYRGEYAAHLLKKTDWRGEYVGIDPWENVPGYRDGINLSDREGDHTKAIKALAGQLHRASFMRMTSADAAPLFDRGSVGMVYLDGNHKYEYVKHDLRIWWDVIRDGGIIAGHDILGNYHHKAVARAVREVCRQRGLMAGIIKGRRQKGLEAASYVIRKP